MDVDDDFVEIVTSSRFLERRRAENVTRHNASIPTKAVSMKRKGGGRQGATTKDRISKSSSTNIPKLWGAKLHVPSTDANVSNIPGLRSANGNMYLGSWLLSLTLG